MVMNILIIKIPEEREITKQACRYESVVFFPTSNISKLQRKSWVNIQMKESEEKVTMYLQ